MLQIFIYSANTFLVRVSFLTTDWQLVVQLGRKCVEMHSIHNSSRDWVIFRFLLSLANDELSNREDLFVVSLVHQIGRLLSQIARDREKFRETCWVLMRSGRSRSIIISQNGKCNESCCTSSHLGLHCVHYLFAARCLHWLTESLRAKYFSNQLCCSSFVADILSYGYWWLCLFW
jgi:hypothetical protein